MFSPPDPPFFAFSSSLSNIALLFTNSRMTFKGLKIVDKILGTPGLCNSMLFIAQMRPSTSLNSLRSLDQCESSPGTFFALLFRVGMDVSSECMKSTIAFSLVTSIGLYIALE